MSEQDAVLAIIGGVRDMQVVLEKVWEHLLPALQPEALPAHPQAYGELCDKHEALSLPLPEGQPTSPSAEQRSRRSRAAWRVRQSDGACSYHEREMDR
jgi:hypothetical protein